MPNKNWILLTKFHVEEFCKYIYLAATNAGWLPYLADEGIRYVYYSTHRARRQFGLNQDIPMTLR